MRSQNPSCCLARWQPVRFVPAARYVNKRKIIEEENLSFIFCEYSKLSSKYNLFLQSVSNNLHRIHQSASVKLAENREKSPVMIDVIRLSRIFDLTRTTIQMYNSMNRIEWEKSTVRHMIELWCRKKHSEKELCVECRELLTNLLSIFLAIKSIHISCTLQSFCYLCGKH